MRADATAARDAFDFADPPEPISGFVSVAFTGREGERLLRDYRPHDPTGARWDVVVRSDQAGRAYRVEVPLEGALPTEFDWVAIVVGGASVVDLRASGGFGGIVSSAAFQTEWTIAAGPAEWVETVLDELRADVTRFSLAAPRPNPARRAAGVAVDFDVPHDSEVTVAVFDVRGRRVRSLVTGRLTRGVHHLYWDGTESGGRHVVSGVYFVVARTPESTHARKVTILE
jgi:hypothetical protein